MFQAGSFVAQHLSDVSSEQIQPNGVDLTIDEILEPVDQGGIYQDGKKVSNRTSLTMREDNEGRNIYDLGKGGYIVKYGETISIPEGHIGFVLPRSSLMRNAAMLHTAVWDAGYEGRGEGYLDVQQPIILEEGARVGQIVYAEADHTGTYDGSYQGENLD